MSGQPPANGTGSLPLLALFQRLIDRGAALGVRDYLDVLRALEAGYGGCDPRSLQKLCQNLWARTEEERRTIHNWFDSIEPLPAEVLTTLVQRLSQLEERDPKIADVDHHPPGSGAGEHTPANANKVGGAPGEVDAATPRARVSITPEWRGQGLGLPHLNACPVVSDTYVLRPRPNLPLRQLSLLWRRLRRTQRGGCGQELDLESSVRRRCERGVLSQPVLRPSRRNTARLLVLADASPSMAPWRPFLEVMEASLAYGRLGDAALRWFSNVPGSSVYGSPGLERPGLLEDLVRRFLGTPLLVVSDAGSARGALSRRRLRRTRAFLDHVVSLGGRVVWINPMPVDRWSATSAERIAAEDSVVMLPLDGTNLTRAVDLLRGAK
jgi:hypothetical protein